jgi:hypothetical protein
MAARIPKSSFRMAFLLVLPYERLHGVALACAADENNLFLLFTINHEIVNEVLIVSTLFAISSL